MDSKSAIAAEVFDYVYSHAPASTGPTSTLGLAHMEFLAEQLRLSLKDLSLYVLAYYLDCTHSSRLFDITRDEFVTGLSKCITHSNRVKSRDGYAAAFDDLRRAVLMTNAKIRESDKEREAFSTFLYMWCLKSNKAEDRTVIATELWELFYTAGKISKDEKVFTGYVHFARLDDWILFVQSADFDASFRVTLDLWNQLRLFASLTSYENHNPDDAWPIAIDAFVEWLRSTRAGSLKATGG